MEMAQFVQYLVDGLRMVGGKGVGGKQLADGLQGLLVALVGALVVMQRGADIGGRHKAAQNVALQGALDNQASNAGYLA